MMLKLHEWSHEIWSKNVIFKCKNHVPHLLFHVQIVVFRNSFFRHLNKALIILKIYLIQTNFGFIVCYDIDNVHIEVNIRGRMQDFKLGGGGGLKKISNMTKFYCPNKSIYYFVKINTKISTSFRQSMLISFWMIWSQYVHYQCHSRRWNQNWGVWDIFCKLLRWRKKWITKNYNLNVK